LFTAQRNKGTERRINLRCLSERLQSRNCEKTLKNVRYRIINAKTSNSYMYVELGVNIIKYLRIIDNLTRSQLRL